MRALPFRFLLGTLGVLASPASATDLFVGPGQTHTEIFSAVAAANHGDRVFVEPGVYQAFALDKGIEVRGAGADLVRVEGDSLGTDSSISDVPLGEVAVVMGLAFERGGGGIGSAPLLTIANNAGTVLLQQVDVNLAPTVFVRAAGIEVEDSARVFLQGCRVLGGEAPFSSGNEGHPALRATGSSLDITDSGFLGGDGTEGSFGFGPVGGAGIDFVDGELRLARVVAVGGRGGWDNTVIVPWFGGPGVAVASGELIVTGGPTNLILGGNGGENSVTSAFGEAGLWLTENSTAELAADVAVEGGIGGFFPTQAAPYSVHPGSTLTPLAWNLPALVPTPPEALPGSVFTMELSGEPGALVVPVLGTDLGPPLALQDIAGIVHLGLLAYFPLPVALLDGQGLGAAQGFVPNLPGVAGAHAWFQSVEVAGSAIRLSGVTRIAVSL